MYHYKNVKFIIKIQNIYAYAYLKNRMRATNHALRILKINIFKDAFILQNIQDSNFHSFKN